MDNEYVEPGKQESENTTKPKIKKVKKAQKRSQSFHVIIHLLNGEFLMKDFVVKNLTYVFFVFLLLILVISKGYYAKSLVQSIDTIQKDTNAKTAQYVELKARLEYQTRRNELVRRLNPVGLFETKKPAKVIRIKKGTK